MDIDILFMFWSNFESLTLTKLRIQSKQKWRKYMHVILCRDRYILVKIRLGANPPVPSYPIKKK
jgi:hypothetical protein